MKNLILAVLAFVVLCPAGGAQVKRSLPSKVAAYASTHKRLLVADAIIIAAWSADAASSTRAQASGCCVETNPVIGPHPSNAQTWAWAGFMAALGVTGEHLIWWGANRAGDPEAGHVLIWLYPVAFSIIEFDNVRSNLKYAANGPNPERLRAARARVSR